MFAVTAALSEKIVALDDTVKNMINSSDAASLVAKLRACKVRAVAASVSAFLRVRARVCACVRVCVCVSGEVRGTVMTVHGGCAGPVLYAG